MTRLGLVRAVGAGDWLVHQRRVAAVDLIAYASSWRGPNQAPVRSAASLVRSNVWSMRESYVRMMLVLAGLPEPKTNVWVGSDHEPIAIVDMAYLKWKVVVEYDGYQHGSDRHQWETDVTRLSDLDDSGWDVVRVTNKQLRRPRQVVVRVWRKLVAAGYDGPPPTFGSAWSALFEPAAVQI